ncbi:MAG: hypothetical protein GY844_28415, partial [Bradyrhizobium sp.]|nr:hypothetical protein [Bradyrhizobium sp.]
MTFTPTDNDQVAEGAAITPESPESPEGPESPEAAPAPVSDPDPKTASDAEQPDGERVAAAASPKAIVEAILFAAEKPVSPRQLAAVVDGLDVRKVRKFIEELRAEYDEGGRA